MDLGFSASSFKTVLAIDNDCAAVKTFNKNRRDPIAVQKDLSKCSARQILSLIRKLPTPPRGLIGGPPCQGFSFGNIQQAKHNNRDPRNRLPFKYALLLKAITGAFPIDFFVFENVLGLKQERHQERFSRIKTAFRNAGFNIFEHELDASKFGVPQTRTRLFIVGVNSRRFPDVVFSFPVGDITPPTLRDTIEKLPPPIFFKRGIKPTEIPYHANHWTMKPKSKRFRAGAALGGRSFRRLNWDEPSPTVAYGHREIHVHPSGIRRLSIHEAMLIQGFPRRYKLVGNLSQQVTQVSNAVPPPVAEAIARAIQSQLYKPIRKEPVHVARG